MHARRVVVLDADGEQVAFAFRNGQSEGLPAGAQSTRLLRMVMRDASGGATSSDPAWYDLLYPNGDVLRHDASTGDAAWLRTKDGRVHTAASRGLDACSRVLEEAQGALGSHRWPEMALLVSRKGRWLCCSHPLREHDTISFGHTFHLSC